MLRRLFIIFQANGFPIAHPDLTGLEVIQVAGKEWRVLDILPREACY